MVSGKKHNKQKDVGKIRNKTDLARMKEYSSKLWFGTIKKTWIKRPKFHSHNMATPDPDP